MSPTDDLAERSRGQHDWQARIVVDEETLRFRVEMRALSKMTDSTHVHAGADFDSFESARSALESDGFIEAPMPNPSKHVESDDWVFHRRSSVDRIGLVGPCIDDWPPHRTLTDRRQQGRGQ